MNSVRPSPLAGRWYPADAGALRAEVQACLVGAGSCELPGRATGVLAPHAGLRFSGPVAGHSFKVVEAVRPELVVVVGPLHYHHGAALLTTGHGAYLTPLGEVPVDGEAAEYLEMALRQVDGPSLTPIRNDPEHSVEIELPFLQCVLGSFRLVPVMMVDQRSEVARALGRALAMLVRDRGAFVVASSDLSHFYSQTEAEALDRVMLDRVAAFDPAGVLGVEEQGRGYACGRGAIAAMFWGLGENGSDRVTLLNQATSGDINGDRDSVVGYAAAAVTAPLAKS